MSMTRRIRVAIVAAAPLIAWVPFSSTAGSAVTGAACHAEKTGTTYEFDGSVESTSSSDSMTFRIADYAGEFHGAPSTDLPTDAKNDFGIAIMDSNTDAVLYSEHTPDNIAYDVTYAKLVQGWAITNARLVFARFTPSFDKRNVTDATCTADSPSFTFVGANATECADVKHGICPIVGT
jgi:hypothetical protein